MINVKQYDLDMKHVDIVAVYDFDKQEIADEYKHIGETKDSNRVKWSELDQEHKDFLNKNRSIQRTKTKVRRLVISQNMRYMWTLTFKHKFNIVKGIEKDAGNLEDAWAMWSAFIKRCKRAGLNFKYIVTVEMQEKRLQKYGEAVYHFHFVTDQSLAVNEKKAKQMKVDVNISDLWGHGYVFVSSSIQGKSFAARYITKYITKMFDEIGKASHRYRCSLGMVIPCDKMRFKSELELDLYVNEIANRQGLEMHKEYYPIMDGNIEVLVYILRPKYRPPNNKPNWRK